MTVPAVPQPNDVLRSHMSAAVQAAGLSDTETDIPPGGSARKRARFDPRAGSRLATVSLVQDDEVLRWVYDPPPASPRRRARRAGLGADDQEVILGFQFLDVPPNEVIARLEDLDLSMTPSRGLRRWVNGQPAAVPKTRPKGRVLLLVHGTFSRDAGREDIPRQVRKEVRDRSDVRSSDAGAEPVAERTRPRARDGRLHRPD